MMEEMKKVAGAVPKEAETNAATPSAGRKAFAFPKLDEKQLEMKRADTNGVGPIFSVTDVTGAEGTSAPLNSNAPAFVLSASSPFRNGGAGGMMGVDSPLSSAAYLAHLQQQSLQYQLHQVYTPEQEVFMTHDMLQRCPHSVLLMVLTSLVEEHPQLCPFLRQRCEKAAVVFAQQQHQQQQHQQQQQQQHQQQQAAGRYAHNPAAPPWTGHNNASNYESPRAAGFTGNASPHAGSTRKGRGAKNREEGLCSVHNSMRSMNHLQLNKQTGQYECVHGFHCLEEGSSSAVTPSNHQNPSSPSHHHTSSSGNRAHTRPAARLAKAAKDSLGAIAINSHTESSRSNSGGVTPPQEGSEHLAKDNNAIVFGADLDVLKNILQSVREMSEREDC